MTGALDAPIRAAIHDLQARLGSIHIAVTAVADLDLDRDARSSMLTSASEESVRASAELSAVGALASCLLDDAAPLECDLADALTRAADLTRLGGLDVELHSEPAKAIAAPSRLDTALPALLRLVAGADRRVVASCSGNQLRLVRGGDDTEPLPSVAKHLVAALGNGLDVVCEVPE